MDNLTHSLTGIVCSRAGLNRLTPQASWILLLSANAPDIDVVTAAGGSLNYLHWHRHITHSLIAAPLLALLCVALVRIFSRDAAGSFAWAPSFGVALIGLATHLLWDLATVYGTRVLLPFSARAVHWDVMSIVDIWVWIALFLCLAGPVLGRLVNSEIGASGKRALPGRGFAVAGLIFILLWTGARTVLHSRAMSLMDARQYDDAPALRLVALPSPTNPFQWQGIAETAQSYQRFGINVLRPFRAIPDEVLPKPEPSPAISVASRMPEFRELLNFAQLPLFGTMPSAELERGTRVELRDLRFPFTAVAILDPSLRVRESYFSLRGRQ